MDRMIDTYLLEVKDEPETWLCFFRKNGVSMSASKTGLRDLWEFAGKRLLHRASTRCSTAHPTVLGLNEAKTHSGWSNDIALLTLGQDHRAPALPGADITGRERP